MKTCTFKLLANSPLQRTSFKWRIDHIISITYSMVSWEKKLFLISFRKTKLHQFCSNPAKTWPTFSPLKKEFLIPSKQFKDNLRKTKLKTKICRYRKSTSSGWKQERQLQLTYMGEDHQRVTIQHYYQYYHECHLLWVKIIKVLKWNGVPAATCQVLGKNEGTQLENCYKARWFTVGQRPAMAYA